MLHADVMSKRRAYEKGVEEIDHGCFSPLVPLASGGLSPTATVAYKKLAAIYDCIKAQSNILAFNRRHN